MDGSGSIKEADKDMDIKHTIDMIAGYYNGHREYLRNKSYSDRYSTVYTTEGSNAWLVIEKKGDTSLEVRLTDNEGLIIARDVYCIVNDEAVIKSADRKVKDSDTMVSFLPEELSILQSFGEDQANDTVDHLRIIAPLIQDEQARNVAFRVADKIDMLPEMTYSELLSTTNRRYELNVEHSIRIWKSKKKEQGAVGNKGRCSITRDKGKRSL